jgi:putative addiction module component (TIGR02574 family)
LEAQRIAGRLVGERAGDDLAAHPNKVPVSPDQIAELDRRMDEYQLDPSRATSWEEILGK